MVTGSVSTPPDGVATIIAAIAPIVVGGVTTYFKIFLVPKQGFRNRMLLKRGELHEHLAMRLVALLQHLRSLCLTGTSDAPLRGDGREQPDLVDEYLRESLRVFTICHKLGILEKVVKWSYLFLYATIVSGLAGVLFAWLAPASRTWVLWISIGLVAVQVITVFVVQAAAWKLDEYEDVA